MVNHPNRNARLTRALAAAEADYQAAQSAANRTYNDAVSKLDQVRLGRVSYTRFVYTTEVPREISEPYTISAPDYAARLLEIEAVRDATMRRAYEVFQTARANAIADKTAVR